MLHVWYNPYMESMGFPNFSMCQALMTTVAEFPWKSLRNPTSRAMRMKARSRIIWAWKAGVEG